MYIVESRNRDGVLNAKYYNADDPKGFITGISENDIYLFYFQHNKDSDGATREQLEKWLWNRGELIIREITW